MILGQLIDQITFEGGVTGNLNYDSFVEATIRDILDKYTAQVRYPDLLVVDQTQSLSGLFGVFNLPSDFQHGDWNSLRYRPGGDPDQDRPLNPFNGSNTGSNVGLTNWYTFRANTIGTRAIEYWPNTEVDPSDEIIFNYWKKGSSYLVNLTSPIVPDLLVPTIKLEAIARTSLQNGTGKMNFSAFQNMAREARAASMGALELPGAND